ncbi:unnamed protein product [Microthlaspi erraticum]|uniref:Uncharacterized protein n=1 Tax=Microthlaspi erraticum TaxID=1685480 RepID=A0A6D2HXY6_9BRAS|nr:unnamed protein product [Microthlaspi erraticum]
MPVLLRNCPHLDTLILKINAEMRAPAFPGRTKVFTDILSSENDRDSRVSRNYERDDPKVYKLILEMIGLYNKLLSCDVQLLVSDFLDEKWTAQGYI